MTRRPSAPSPQPANLSIEQMRRGVVAIKRRVADLEAFDPDKVPERGDPKVTALEKSIDETLSDVFGHNTTDFIRYRDASSLDDGPHFISMGLGPPHVHPFRDYLRDGKAHALTILQGAIRGLEERIADQETASNSVPSRQSSPVRSFGGSSKVFVVHGHDEAARESMARFLEKIQLEAIILREQPDQGLTIIEKFETYAKQVAFAVVLLTPDDLGGTASISNQAGRARQNVIFELGYFAGKLGRGRACLVRKGDVEIPSDLYGVIYTEMDALDGWKFKLVKELKAAGLEFDANKVWE